MNPICSVDDCNGRADRKGMCEKHYTRVRRHGDPLFAEKEPGGGLRWLNEQLSTGLSAECWEWPFHRDKDGYGQLTLNGRRYRAHAVALILSGQPRPSAPNNLALHSCDNPPCCNPAHLRWGSVRQNAMDSVERGRWSRAAKHSGSHSPNAKLTEAAVLSIRRDGRNDQQIGESFGIHPSTVNRIRAGKAWTHVSEDVR